MRQLRLRSRRGQCSPTQPIIAVAILAAVLLFADASNLSGQDTRDQPRVISVTGKGKVTSPPDVATIRFNVVTRDADPETARAANAEASKQALNTIRNLGVDEDKIQLDHLSLAPLREWDQEKRRHIDIGFEVNRGVLVELDDLDLVPTVVAQIVQSGANRISRVGYSLSNDDEAQVNALARAVENARDKATVMLSALNESLGKVVEVREQSVHPPTPIVRAYAATAVEKSSDSSPEAYAPGLIEVTAQAVVTFEIQ